MANFIEKLKKNSELIFVAGIFFLILINFGAIGLLSIDKVKQYWPETKRFIDIYFNTTDLDFPLINEEYTIIAQTDKLLIEQSILTWKDGVINSTFYLFFIKVSY